MSRFPSIAVLISGGGRSLLNLLDRIEQGSLSARLGLVIASGECVGAARARARGLAVRVMPGVIPADQLADTLRAHAIDWVVLAGYLKMLRIPPGYEHRVLNIHPALLPKYGGKGMFGHHVHEAVIRAGERESGCTVHFCDARFDTGPIVLQRRCPVWPNDTPETLAARVFEQECLAYPEALNLVLSGNVTFESASKGER